MADRLDKALEKFLDALVTMVNDDNSPWQEKVQLLRSKAKEHEAWSTSLEEFLAWFDTDTESISDG